MLDRHARQQQFRGVPVLRQRRHDRALLHNLLVDGGVENGLPRLGAILQMHPDVYHCIEDLAQAVSARPALKQQKSLDVCAPGIQRVRMSTISCAHLPAVTGPTSLQKRGPNDQGSEILV